MLETIQRLTVFDGDRNGVPCCRRAVAERTPTKISRHNVVHGEVVGLMNGELVMGGIFEGDCRDSNKCQSQVSK